MKSKILVLLLLFCLFLISCENITTPDIPEYTPPATTVSADIRLVGTLKRTYTDYGTPRFEGYVGNFGTGTGYNCKVAITCYSDENKNTIIDTANGFPANLGDIKPGKNAYFEAIAFDCESHDQIKSYDVEITWLDKD